MPVRVENFTTGAGSDSGKKPVCVQAPLGSIVLLSALFSDTPSLRNIINYKAVHIIT